ncbi:MAG: DNA polymerase subunit beta [Bacteroides oleiciplenus]|nr:DNA polymerase subunit beta [Bacteroides oleiciplenus]
MKSTSEILELLKLYKQANAHKYGFSRLGIFGSVARGEQTEHSDVDICYEGEAPSLLALDRIQSELEELLGSPVDLVRMRERMNGYLKKRIQKEGIYV